MAWVNVDRCQSVFLGAKVSIRHFGTSADMSGEFSTAADGHFGSSAEMSCVRSDLGPKFFLTPLLLHLICERDEVVFCCYMCTAYYLALQ